MADVFISYARADVEEAAKLAAALESLQWSVWWDRDIAVGQSFDETIERELREAKAVVTLWSRASVDRPWVRNEARAAAKRGILAPAKIEEVELPLEFSNVETADLKGWKGEKDHDGFKKLCASIACGTGPLAAEPISRLSTPGKQDERKTAWARWRHSTPAMLGLSLAVGIVFLAAVFGLPALVAKYRLASETKSDEDAKKGLEISASSQLVKALEPDLSVGQLLGTPFVLATLHVGNSNSSTTWINEISGSLRSRDETLILSSVSWTILNPFNPLFPVTGPFPIPAGTDLDLRLFMIGSGMSFVNLFNDIAALPEYKGQQACIQKANGALDPLTDDAFQIVSTFFTQHFVWTEGPWHFTIKAKMGDQMKTFERDFTLSASDIERLRASIALNRRCVAVTPLAPLAQDGVMANFVSK
jgi:TIR domain